MFRQDGRHLSGFQMAELPDFRSHSKSRLFATQGRFHKSWAHSANIEIALLKLGTRLKVRSTPVKSFSKVWRKVQIGRKTVYDIDPGKEDQQQKKRRRVK